MIALQVHEAVSVEVVDGGCVGNPPSADILIKNAVGDTLLEITVFSDHSLWDTGLPVHVDGMPAARYQRRRPSAEQAGDAATAEGL